jgi:hypothetical protein
MQRPARITRAHVQVLALPRPQPVAGAGWLVAAVAVALVLFGLML